MQRPIRYRDRTYVKGLPRSLYHAIDRLAAAGLVEAGEPTREGRRPERTVYSITEAGREELEGWLADLLATPDANDPSAYSAALSLIPYLTPEQALAALRPRRSSLELELAGGRHAWRACARGDRARVHRGADRQLERGELTWDVDELRRLAESARDGDLANLRAALGDAQG